VQNAIDVSPDNGHVAVRAPAQEDAVRRELLHLILVHVLDLDSRERRLHPGLLLQYLDSQHADAPALLCFRHLAAHRMREHLVPEADADESPPQ
jgi:hypothetical protein